MKYHFAKDAAWPPHTNIENWRERGWTGIHWMELRYFDRLAALLRGKYRYEDLDKSFRGERK